MIRFTDSRKHGWVRKGQMNQVTTTRRLEGVNLIAALCSTGEMMYSVNIGKTNRFTFGFFLSKLCSHLDGEDPDWRLKTVILLDNAS